MAERNGERGMNGQRPQIGDPNAGRFVVGQVLTHAVPGGSWDAARDLLVGAMEAAAARRSQRSVDERAACLHRFVLPVGPGDALAWLRRQPTAMRVYWSPRDGGPEVAGVGAADEVGVSAGRAFDELRSALTDRFRHGDQQVRYFGGFRFSDGAEPSPEWAGFGGGRFVLPRLAFLVHEGAHHLELNVMGPLTPRTISTVCEELERLDFQQPAAEIPVLPDAVGRQNAPDEAGWSRNVRRVLSDFSRSRLSKVVLARRTRFDLSAPIDPTDLLAVLRRRTPGCYRFLYQFEAGVAFVGVSPERLLRISGDRIWSEAVAGTRPRAETSLRDDELARELLASEKEQREHQFVRQTVKELLSEVCDVLLVDAKASEMKLNRGRHLVSRFRGSLRPDVRRLRLIEMLHPTPAVGGHPTGDAVHVIDDLEPFDRGWYAAPVGWVAPGHMEFAVGIRSALTMGPVMYVYSGAGIVAGSDAHKEWLEIENKIEDYSTVLTFVDAGSEHQ